MLLLRPYLSMLFCPFLSFVIFIVTFSCAKSPGELVSFHWLHIPLRRAKLKQV